MNDSYWAYLYSCRGDNNGNRIGYRNELIGYEADCGLDNQLIGYGLSCGLVEGQVIGADIRYIY